MPAPPTRTELEEFRNRIGFLRAVPDRIFFRLDPGEFLLPDEKLSDALNALEAALDAHVMTYRRGVLRTDVPIDCHLCAHLALKRLTKKQKALIEEYEALHGDRGVNFCAYEKPLRIVEGRRNPTYRLLRRFLA